MQIADETNENEYVKKGLSVQLIGHRRKMNFLENRRQPGHYFRAKLEKNPLYRIEVDFS